MIKTFPKSRVCVIDACLSIEQGVKKALDFTKLHSIPLHSNDGKKILYTFCLKQLEKDYKQTQSPYNKVFFASKNITNKKIQNFVDNYFDSLIKQTTLPYCGRHNVTSPDLENAAHNCSNKSPVFTKQRVEQLMKALSRS